MSEQVAFKQLNKRLASALSNEDEGRERKRPRLEKLDDSDQDPMIEDSEDVEMLHVEPPAPVSQMSKRNPRGSLPPEPGIKKLYTLDGELFDPSRWARPSCDKLVNDIEDGRTEFLTYQQMTTDYIVASSSWFPESGMHKKYNYIPVIRTFGNTQEGVSICHYKTGFFPYCYIEAPMQRLTPKDVQEFKVTLEERIKNAGGTCEDTKEEIDKKTANLIMGKQKRISDIKNNIAVHDVEIVYRYSARNYHELKAPFYKVYFTLPHYVATFKGIAKDAAFRAWTTPVHGDWRTYVKENCANIEARSAYVLPQKLYEDNILFELRFMIDVGMTGFSWCQVPITKPDAPFSLRKGDSASLTRAQIEIQSHYKTTLFHDPKTEPWANMMSNFRVMAFDTEWVSQDGGFPDRTSQMIQVAAYVKEYTAKDPDEARKMAEQEDREKKRAENEKKVKALREIVINNYKKCESKRARTLMKLYKVRLDREAKKNIVTENINTLASVGLMIGKASKIEGADVFCFKTEEDVHIAFCDLIRHTDPDIITGYNIDAFDMRVWMDRMQFLRIKQLGSRISRVKWFESYYRKTNFQSRAAGKTESIENVVPGRVCFDLLTWMQREVKLASYTLGSVSKTFVGDQKDDVDHTMIPILFRGSDDDRRRLMKYCLKDAYLCILIPWKMCTWVKESENCKLTGIQSSMVLTRGQSIKVYRQVLSFTKEYGYVVPNEKASFKSNDPQDEEVEYDYDPEKYKDINQADEGYEGAVVVEPTVGFYTEPVVTLDFASLYPSIMIAHNLCPTTEITKEQAEKMDPKDYTLTPAGYYFVKKHIKAGIMPRVLEILLAARADVRKQLATAKGILKLMLDMRQLKIKINANSVYGFTGATVSQLYTKSVAASVTAFGRDMITLVKRSVQEEYTTDNGYDFDTQVIYGDTDSVMIRLLFAIQPEFKRCFEIGAELSKFATGCFAEINKTFPKAVISMNFEKIYKPYLLLKKKKYAGVMWERPEKYTKVDVKGLETVRRETTEYVRKTLKKCLNIILLKEDIEGAIAYAKKRIKKLRAGDVEINDLVITKQYNGKSKTKQPHVELAKRLAERDKNAAPQKGTRIPYVLIRSHKKATNSDKSEDPFYAFKHGLEIDYDFYMTKQLLEPLKRIFGMLTDVEKLIDGTEPDKLVKKIYTEPPTDGKKSLITHHFNTKKTNCIGCNRQVAMYSKGLANPETSFMCVDCVSNFSVVEKRVIEEHDSLEKDYKAIYKYCQECQKTTGEVLCNEKECSVFFLRNKTRREYEEAQQRVVKLDITRVAW